jgi:hypothetical protein
MTTLLTYAGPVEADAPVTRTGGTPLAPAGFEWPGCASCGGPMQFLAQLVLADCLLAIFMCQNDPGLCDEWDPAAGANLALVLPREGLAATAVPDRGVPLLPEVSGVEQVTTAADYEQAREQWAAAAGRSRRHVLGQLGGTPSWLQGDETPSCPSCSAPMDFVAQLEEGHHGRAAMNFGGGAAYAFRCVPCARGAFLWQS